MAVVAVAGEQNAKRLERTRTAVQEFFFQAEDGIRDLYVTGVQTCALPICLQGRQARGRRMGAGARLVRQLADRAAALLPRVRDLAGLPVQGRRDRKSVV